MLASSQASDQRKPSATKDKASFCTVVRQMLISQVLPSTLVYTCRSLSPSPIKYDHFHLKHISLLLRQCLGKLHIFQSSTGHATSKLSSSSSSIPFTTSFLHLSMFSTALWDLANSRPVHSLLLSSHLFLCLPHLLPPFTVPCKMVLARPNEWET